MTIFIIFKNDSHQFFKNCLYRLLNNYLATIISFLYFYNTIKCKFKEI